jgi:hypothetical protein
MNGEKLGVPGRNFLYEKKTKSRHFLASENYTKKNSWQVDRFASSKVD